MVGAFLGATAAACAAFGVSPSDAPAPAEAAPDAAVDSAGIVPPPLPDAAAPFLGGCQQRECDRGSCLDDACGSDGARVWPELVRDGGTFTFDLDCYGKTMAANQVVYRSATLPGGPRYAYSLRFIINSLGTGTGRTLVAEIGTEVAPAVQVYLEGNSLAVCSMQSSCSAPIPLPAASSDARLLFLEGTIGSAVPAGKVTISDGQATCKERGALELGGPIAGAFVTAKIGCLGGDACDVRWDDARFSVQTY